MMNPILVRLPEDMRRALDAKARRQHKLLSAVMREAIHEYAEAIRLTRGADSHEIAIASHNGEIWIPKALRQELRMEPGEEFRVTPLPNGLKLKRVNSPHEPREGPAAS